MTSFLSNKLEAVLFELPHIHRLNLPTLETFIYPLNVEQRNQLLAYVNDRLASGAPVGEMHDLIASFSHIFRAVPAAFATEHLSSIFQAFTYICQLVSRAEFEPLPLDNVVKEVAREVGILLPSKGLRKNPRQRCLSLIYICTLIFRGFFADKLSASVENFKARFPEFHLENKNWLSICKKFDPRFREAHLKSSTGFKAWKDWQDRFFRDLDDEELQTLVRVHNIMTIAVQLTNNKESKCVELAVLFAERGNEFAGGSDNGPSNIRRKYLHCRLEAMKPITVGKAREIIKECHDDLMEAPSRAVIKRKARSCAKECAEDLPPEVASRKIQRSQTYPRSAEMLVPDIFRSFQGLDMKNTADGIREHFDPISTLTMARPAILVSDECFVDLTDMTDEYEHSLVFHREDSSLFVCEDTSYSQPSDIGDDLLTLCSVCDRFTGLCDCGPA